MLNNFQPLFKAPNNSVSWQVWAGSRVAALCIALVLLIGLFALKPPQLLPETQQVQSVYVTTPIIERPAVVPPAVSKPVIPPPFQQVPKPQSVPAAAPKLPQAQQPQAQQQQVQKREAQRAMPPPQTAPRTPPSQSVGGAASLITSPNLLPPRIAMAPSSQVTAPVSQGGSARGNGSSGMGPRQLGAATIGILRARQCLSLDIANRPADCPPNEELLRMLASERGPQYRPKNAEGFSRNEQRWRDIPPPCLADGKSFSVSGPSACVRVGNVPSRVRTIREICEAKGLGGCAPTPSQAAVNAALEQVRRQEVAKEAEKTGNQR